MVGYTNSKNYTEKKQNRQKQKCQYWKLLITNLTYSKNENKEKLHVKLKLHIKNWDLAKVTIKMYNLATSMNGK